MTSLVVRPAYVRRRITFAVVAVVVLIVGIYLPVSLLGPVAAVQPVVSAAPTLTQPAAVLPFPSDGASAIGQVGRPGLLGTGGTDAALPIASISKIITVLVALQVKPVADGSSGPTVTFTAADAELRQKYVALNGETAPMVAGSTLSQLDVMRVTLIVSANNYADALAIWAYGSEKAYVAAADKWLDANGLDHTTIVEPTGINPKNTSTATDLVKLGTLAIANPVVASIVATPTLSLPGVGTFKNTNTLLGASGVDGIKTGTLVPAGSDLLFSADYAIAGQTVTVVGAVLGAVDHKTVDQVVRGLLAETKRGFHAVTLTKAGEKFARYTTPWGETARAVAKKTERVVVWSNTPIATAVTPSAVRIEKRGADAGTLTFTVGATRLTRHLVLDRTIDGPDLWWRLRHPFR